MSSLICLSIYFLSNNSNLIQLDRICYKSKEYFLHFEIIDNDKVPYISLQLPTVIGAAK